MGFTNMLCTSETFHRMYRSETHVSDIAIRTTEKSRVLSSLRKTQTSRIITFSVRSTLQTVVVGSYRSKVGERLRPFW